MGSHKLKMLALSDTHLGEETSLLSFPRGLQHLWHTLRENSAFWEPIFPDFDPDPDDPEKRVEVEELILVGDIADRTLSSTSQISGHSHAFAMMLSDALDIKKVVYIPGNHDHTLWTDYLEARDRSVTPVGITGPQGQNIVQDGTCLAGAEEIASIFLGYPMGWAWWTIKRHRRDFVVSIANPIYAREVAGRTYAFAHGTHFRSEMFPGRKEQVLRWFGRSGLDDLLELDLRRGGDPRGAADLEDLEARVAPFVDSLWPSSKNKPTSRSDELWYLYTMFREGEGRGNWPLELPDGPTRQLERLTDEHGRPTDAALERFRDYFLRHLRRQLEGAQFSSQNLTFVYGDTHRGGWGNLATPDAGGPVRVYNCGSWVVDAPGTHPACHLLAVNEQGEEHLLDVTFAMDARGQAVTVGENTLLELAAQDAEHRSRITKRMAVFSGRKWQSLKNLLG